MDPVERRERCGRLADLDDAAFLLAVLDSQRGLRDPLPLPLLDVLVTFEDLDHFAGVRRDQERG